MPVLRARRGHGRRGSIALQRGSCDHQLNRRVRPVHDDTFLVGKGPKGLAAAPERASLVSFWRRLFPLTPWIPALQPAPTRRLAVGGELHVADGMAAWQSVAAVQTERVLRLVREVFGRDVLGAYEHGSAVLGGVQPTSDIDILVITGRPATLVEKRQLVEGLMTISAPWPPPGPERCVEVTVVAQPQVRRWRYPPSFDLQYGGVAAQALRERG